MGESDKKDKDDNVKVVVRCRPLNQKEIDGGYKNTVSCDEVNGAVTVNRPNDPPKTFSFVSVSIIIDPRS